MRLIKTLVSLGIVVLLAFGLQKAVRLLAPQPPVPPPIPAPTGADDAAARLLAISLNDASGTLQSLHQWQGQALLLNFWASWCGPCMDEIPQLDAAARRRQPGEPQIVGIALDSADNVSTFARQTPTHYPLLVADERIRGILPALGNAAQGIPFSILIDAQGHVRHIRLGVLHASELQKWLLSAKDHSVPNGAKKK